VKYAWIREHRGHFTVAAMCRCLGAARQGYYRWVKKGDDDEADKVLVAEIREVMKETRHTYGPKRVAKALKNRGTLANHKRVGRLMNENNIHPKRVKKKRKTTNSNHEFPASEDRLMRRFKMQTPDRVWVGDITYLKTREGWLYMCIWLDLFSRKIVGWSLSTSLASSFVCESLQSALRRRPGARPLIHSDRGVQYASNEFRRLLWRNKLRQSMSRKGDCWDNSVAESFFGTLKSELELTPGMTAAQVRQLVFEYVEIFYNRIRLHSALGYKSPDIVEQEYRTLKEAS